MLGLFLLTPYLACNISGNNPPRFQSLNGKEVKYLFGFAYLANPEEIFTALPGESVPIDIEVSDINGDSIELLFPKSPAGWEFDSSEKSGVWHVPENPIGYYYSLQALAIDEHGASDILFFNYGIGTAWDTGSWDTAFDPEAILGDIQYVLKGNGNIEAGFLGTLTLEARSSFCSITWEYPQPFGENIDTCNDCSKALKMYPGEARLADTTCDEIFDAYDISIIIEELGLEERVPTTISLGWTPSFLWNDITYENAVLYQEEDVWLPYGTGSIQGNRFEFSLQLP